MLPAAETDDRELVREDPGYFECLLAYGTRGAEDGNPLQSTHSTK